MKLFKCQNCGQMLYFENRNCEKCGHLLGYLADRAKIAALEVADDEWTLTGGDATRYRFCANAGLDACNWLIPADSEATFCIACVHNRTIPDLSAPEHLQAWQKFEVAKHRLFYSLLRLKLPMPTRIEDPAAGLAFDFLADGPSGCGAPVMTGHDEGLITLNLKEADDAEREKLRTLMGEPYRTLLGHFRHEIGHYYWDQLVKDTDKLEACRALFGDDSADYEAALKTYYANGPAPAWQDSFVSAYATSHPWEDFAETWAHYLHIVDTLETARAFGLRIDPIVTDAPEMTASIDFDAYESASIDQIIEAWLPLSFAMNSISRAMGGADLYPFILSAPAIQKLGFINELVKNRPAEKDAIGSV